MRTLLVIIVHVYALTNLDCFCEARRRSKRTDVDFDTDNDIVKYLRDREKEMAVLKCVKVTMIQWLHSVVPYIDLECEVLGDVQSTKWYKNGSNIDKLKDGRFISLSQPHYRKRTFFHKWHDCKLRLLHVTEADNGPYQMVVVGPKGHTEIREIMLEVMTDYREDKWLKWTDKIKDGGNKVRRSERKNIKMRKRELMCELKRRSKQRKRIKNNLIFDE